jgi:hypothetical protein
LTRYFKDKAIVITQATSGLQEATVSVEVLAPQTSCGGSARMRSIVAAAVLAAPANGKAAAREPRKQPNTWLQADG